MSEHRAHIRWQHDGGSFAKRQYSREHSWTFDGGVTVPASPSPLVVPVPYANPANVDPEEAFVAAISSCHMLSFLFAAANAGFEVASYEDEAIGHLTKNDRGVPWVSQVELVPRIVYSGETRPTGEQETDLHHRAHESCYIANSVLTEIIVRATGANSSAN